MHFHLQLLFEIVFFSVSCFFFSYMRFIPCLSLTRDRRFTFTGASQASSDQDLSTLSLPNGNLATHANDHAQLIQVLSSFLFSILRAGKCTLTQQVSITTLDDECAFLIR